MPDHCLSHAPSIAGAPWSIKAFIGATSDALPLWGYHKRPYIALSAFLGALASLCLAGFHFTPASAWLVALLFFCGNFQVFILYSSQYACCRSPLPGQAVNEEVPRSKGVVTFAPIKFMLSHSQLCSHCACMNSFPILRAPRYP